jgi:hypothetical protein
LVTAVPVKTLALSQTARSDQGTRSARPVGGAKRQKWAADGFNVMPPYLPGSLEDFVDHVVPELQRRGLFRTEYTGETLRDHYGLPRPASQYAAQVVPA